MRITEPTHGMSAAPRPVEIELLRDTRWIYPNYDDPMLPTYDTYSANADLDRCLEKKIGRALDDIPITVENVFTTQALLDSSSDAGLARLMHSVRDEITQFEDLHGTTINDITANLYTWRALFHNTRTHLAGLTTGNCSVQFDASGTMANSSVNVPENTVYFTSRAFAIICAYGGGRTDVISRPEKMETLKLVTRYMRVFCTSEQIDWNPPSGHGYGFKMALTA